LTDEASLVAAYDAVIEEINTNETVTGIEHLSAGSSSFREEDNILSNYLL
jgi:hypothetical protein